jgi:hypothetical protein
VLPSVASLRVLRLFARKAEATKAMVGFGDPIFDPAESGLWRTGRRRKADGHRTQFWVGVRPLEGEFSRICLLCTVELSACREFLP